MRVLAVVLALASSACIDALGADVGRYVERDDKRFTVSGRPEVVVSTFDGSIEVRPWDRSDVEVVVEKHAGSKESAATISVDAQQNGDRITVDVRVPPHSGFGFHLNRSAKLIVSVPAATDLTAKSGDGAIDVERIAGTIDLRSGDGSIHARSVKGSLNVTSGDGRINVDGVFEALHAHTGDGSMTILAREGSRTANEWDVSTGDGSITLDLPSAFGAELDAHTGDGGVHLEGVTVGNVNGELRKDRVRGRLGSGGATLRVRTGDGSITLRSGRSSGSGDSR